MRANGKKRSLMIACAALAALAAAQPPAVDEETQAAYQKARLTLAVDPLTGEIVPLKKLDAKLVEGEVVAIAGRRIILNGPSGLISVLQRDPTFPTLGAKVNFVARLNGNFNWLDRTGARQVLPNYTDLTLSLDEFLVYRKSPPGFGISAGKLGNAVRKTPSSFKRKTTSIP